MHSGGIRLAGVLVGAVFIGAALVACEDPAGELVAPQSEGAVFAKPGACPGHPSCKDGDGDAAADPGSETYDYTFSGDVTTNPATGFGATNVGGGDADDLVMDGCCDPPAEEETLNLSAGLVSALGADACFAGRLPTNFSGAMRRQKDDDTRVDANFYFLALDADGANEVKYLLTLQGNVTSGTDDGLFPPEVGETTTVTFANAILETEGKGQAKKGACSSGGVAVSTSVTVTGTS